MNPIDFTYKSTVTGDFESLRVFAGNLKIPHDSGKTKFLGEIEEGETMFITYKIAAPNGTDIVIKYSCTDDDTPNTYEDAEKHSPVETTVKSGASLEEIIHILFVRK